MFPCFPKPLGGPQKLPTGSLKDSVSVIIMGGEWSFKMSLTKYGSRSLVFYVYECLAVSIFFTKFKSTLAVSSFCKAKKVSKYRLFVCCV